MITVKFINAEGESQEAQGVDGQSLLDLAQAVGQPLEGTCEGQMACSTCHVIIDKDWFDKLPPAVEDEEDMLDLATGARRMSRLSCQITLTPALDGMVVHVPAESRNMQGL
jgi:ferredoxin